LGAIRNSFFPREGDLDFVFFGVVAIRMATSSTLIGKKGEQATATRSNRF
jgi:hypothetical protein